MFEFDLDHVQFADIKVIGCGGGGSNAVNRMIAADLKGIHFIALNTDAQALQMSEAHQKIQLGEKLTKGLGAGSDPTVGQRAAEESREEIAQALEGADMVFITAGMGAELERVLLPWWLRWPKSCMPLRWEVTKPFSFEGRRRKEQAEKGIELLKSKVDTLITIPNDRLLQVVENEPPCWMRLR